LVGETAIGHARLQPESQLKISSAAFLFAVRPAIVKPRSDTGRRS
jgi:hypothetical protein